MIGTVIADTILQTPEDLCPNMDCMWQDRRYIRPRKKSNTPNDNWDINLASKKDLLQPKAPDSEIAFAQYYSFLPDTKVEPIDSLPKTESTRTPLNSVHNLCPCGGKVIVWCFQGAVCRRHNFTIHIITPNVFFYRNFDPRFSTVHGTRPNENVTKNQMGYDDVLYTLVVFILLGIERFLYGYLYCYPTQFKTDIRRGTFGTALQTEALYWKCAMRLGMSMKVFQFTVIGYDLIQTCDALHDPFMFSFRPSHLCYVGVSMLATGQLLNSWVFKKLGAIGVYYGHELGYTVPRITGFPYNIWVISDPQYWGVILTIWGLYVTLGTSSFLVPLIETFWYGASITVLEHDRGRTVAYSLFGEDLPGVSSARVA